MHALRYWRLPALAAIAVLLTSCAASRIRPDADLMSAQEQREQQLAVVSDWSLKGRLALSGPGDSGSGSLDWQQEGVDYVFTMHAPVTGKTWTLSGNGDYAELAGLQAQPVTARDASTLLERELGWKVPVVELAHWVRGLRAPGAAEIIFRPDGLPAEFRQDGWLIEYREYDETRDPPLPRRIFASNGEYKVRLAIQRWA
ncbi:lipoprotein insertase outer membrane protein LolB, partial [Dokdonella sp.]|uniref:lipoprotein insertase outer membrane protein LolB n=1 Tax=Dokdonella sp. TaxID=2291710 RepID=UPI003C3F2A78